MRRLLITCLIATFAGALAAQPTPRATNKNTIKTTLVPASANQRNNNTKAQNDGRVAQPQHSPDITSLRTDADAAESRTAQPAGANATSRTALARPSLAAPNGTTARTVTNSLKKTAPLGEVNPVRVKWMTLEEALEKSKTEKRKIFVDVFTDWCGWCKRMDSTTFVNPAVAEYLNEHYYPVKFNAEQQEDITYKDKTYHFKKNGARGFHELAAEWLNNRLSYPTVVFLDENQGVIQPLPGYQDASKMEAILNYFGTDSHKKTPWESYEKNFNQQR